ncbi:methyltransferase [Nocardiopsis sp. HUAS JQ3]|uniref:methyltransferase n=1 Tax=Nocardiopsis sp. HUAS JQ3 TaxID=3061629 RepID=UPI0023A9E3C9|nr:methyltransferase [Nocardiopsis sp. HUAS JQ3]WDZ88681.1 methyltransferase [Nocardiopsis sp. HUAS JQ3]
MTGDGSAEREVLRLMTGPWVARAVATAVELGVLDRLAGGAADAAALAAGLDLRPDRLERLLRLLAAVGVVEHRDGRYRPTQVGAALHRDHPSGMADLALLYDSDMFTAAWARLGESVRTGGTAFEAAHGTDVFTHLERHPADAARYTAGMAASGRFSTAVPDVHDFTGARTVVDLGGGDGELLATVLARAPHARGVLVERPPALAAARARLGAYVEAGRCELVEGDFLRGVPRGADAYLLSRVLHNWSDQDVRTVLRHCREAMAPDGLVLIAERVLPDEGAAWLTAVLDAHMMVMTTGAERTEREYEALLRSAGLTTRGIRDLPLEMRLLVAEPVRGGA